MAFIALGPRAASRPRASVQQMPYIPRARDITITYLIPHPWECEFGGLE